MDITGKVVSLHHQYDDDYIGVDVETSYGILTGYAHHNMADGVKEMFPTGCYAVIRVYDNGGGFYRDSEIKTIWR